MKKIKILNVQFDACTRDEAIARIFDAVKNRSNETGKQISTPNPEMLLCALNNKDFQDALNGSWLSIPDGIGILWAATFQKSQFCAKPRFLCLKALFSLLFAVVHPKSIRKNFTERVTGVDLMESICAISKTEKYPMFLLGAKTGIAEKAKTMLETKYHGINIVGTFSGSPEEDDFPAIQALIAETRPVFLFVAYGSPKQELWIAKHLRKLPSVKIAMGVGGAFDFIAGVRQRAPKWIQKMGVEWLYRLIQEPSRVRRIYNATIKFPLTIILQRKLPPLPRR